MSNDGSNIACDDVTLGIVDGFDPVAEFIQNKRDKQNVDEAWAYMRKQCSSDNLSLRPTFSLDLLNDIDDGITGSLFELRLKQTEKVKNGTTKKIMSKTRSKKTINNRSKVKPDKGSGEGNRNCHHNKKPGLQIRRDSADCLHRRDLPFPTALVPLESEEKTHDKMTNVVRNGKKMVNEHWGLVTNKFPFEGKIFPAKHLINSYLKKDKSPFDQKRTQIKKHRRGFAGHYANKVIRIEKELEQRGFEFTDRRDEPIFRNTGRGYGYDNPRISTLLDYRDHLSPKGFIWEVPSSDFFGRKLTSPRRPKIDPFSPRESEWKNLLTDSGRFNCLYESKDEMKRREHFSNHLRSRGTERIHEKKIDKGRMGEREKSEFGRINGNEQIHETSNGHYNFKSSFRPMKTFEHRPPRPDIPRPMHPRK